MDVDGNQMVDYHEFVMGTLEDKQLLTEAKLRVAFDYFDEDRNGYIDIGRASLQSCCLLFLLFSQGELSSVNLLAAASY